MYECILSVAIRDFYDFLLKKKTNKTSIRVFTRFINLKRRRYVLKHYAGVNKEN